MMHKKLIATALADLDKDKAGYFQALVEALDKDPRTEKYANLVYLVLRETMRLLPTYLDRAEVIDRLFSFVDRNYGPLRKTLFDEAYVYNPRVIEAVTNRFVEEVVEATMKRYEDGELDTGEATAQKFTWPYRALDLADPDDEDELAEAQQKQAAYTGRDRRKRP